MRVARSIDQTFFEPVQIHLESPNFAKQSLIVRVVRRARATFTLKYSGDTVNNFILPLTHQFGMNVVLHPQLVDRL
jgi:hypothetical protein